MQIQKFSAGTVERIGCVMKITYTTNETLSLDDMKGITIAREKLFGDSEYCSLVDHSKDLLSLTPEARKYVDQNNQIQRLRIAEVLLVKNFGQKLGIATYVKIFRTKDKKGNDRRIGSNGMVEFTICESFKKLIGLRCLPYIF